MSLREVLSELHSNLIEQLTPHWVDINTLTHLNSVLVIRSANIELFQRSIKMLLALNESMYFHVVTHPKDTEQVKEICRGQCEIIPYGHQGAITKTNLQEQLQTLGRACFDASFFLSINESGFGYENIEDILQEINCKHHYFFNTVGVIQELHNIRLRQQTIKLIKALSEWNWEYSLDRGKIGAENRN